MAYLDPYHSSPEHLDSVRRSHFQRSGSRPSGKLRYPSPDLAKAHQRASGRLRTAAYRCKLDTNRKPESSVVGMALLAAVVTRTSLKQLDEASVAIVTAAFNDLLSRGYERGEIRGDFQTVQKMLVPRPGLRVER